MPLSFLEKPQLINITQIGIDSAETTRKRHITDFLKKEDWEYLTSAVKPRFEKRGVGSFRRESELAILAQASEYPFKRTVASPEQLETLLKAHVDAFHATGQNESAIFTSLQLIAYFRQLYGTVVDTLSYELIETVYSVGFNYLKQLQEAKKEPLDIAHTTAVMCTAFPRYKSTSRLLSNELFAFLSKINFKESLMTWEHFGYLKILRPHLMPVSQEFLANGEYYLGFWKRQGRANEFRSTALSVAIALADDIEITEEQGLVLINNAEPVAEKQTQPPEQRSF